MFIIGITGSSGSGKTTVCQIISKLSKTIIIDADEVVRELQDNKTEYYKKIVETFGENILLDNGLINRKALANIIFSDSNEKEKLDKLTTRYVVKEIENRVELLKKEDLDYVVIDAPTLIESGMTSMFDKIIVVTSNMQNKLQRICKRDFITEEDAKKRLMMQNDDEFYKSYADFVIENNDENIEYKVKNVLEQLER